MKIENFHVLTSELTQLTPHQRSILSDRLREIEHVSLCQRTLIEERLSNQRRQRIFYAQLWAFGSTNN